MARFLKAFPICTFLRPSIRGFSFSFSLRIAPLPWERQPRRPPFGLLPHPTGNPFERLNHKTWFKASLRPNPVLLSPRSDRNPAGTGAASEFQSCSAIRAAP